MRAMTSPSAPGCGCAGVSAALHMLRSLAGVSACASPQTSCREVVPCRLRMAAPSRAWATPGVWRRMEHHAGRP